MTIRTALGAAVLALHAALAQAGAPEPVTLDPIRHHEARLEVVGPDGSVRLYAPADLENFATYRLETRTPWREEPAVFEGVLLTDVLHASGLDAAPAISVTAENDFRSVIPRAAWEALPVLIATRVDGMAHTRRARGPLQFVIDMETYRSSVIAEESFLVWMAARIEPAE